MGHLDKSVGMHVVEHRAYARWTRQKNVHFWSPQITKFVYLLHIAHYSMDVWYSQNARLNQGAVSTGYQGPQATERMLYVLDFSKSFPRG